MRWSIRSLLVLMLLVSFFAWRYSASQTFDRRMCWFQEIDAKLFFDWQHPKIEPQPWPPLPPKDLNELLDFYDPRSEVMIKSKSRTEAWPLEWIWTDQFRSVKILSVPISRCSPEFSERLKVLCNLETVCVWMDTDGVNSEETIKLLQKLHPKVQFRAVHAQENGQE